MCAAAGSVAAGERCLVQALRLGRRCACHFTFVVEVERINEALNGRLRCFNQIYIFITCCKILVKYIYNVFANIASNANGTGRDVGPFSLLYLQIWKSHRNGLSCIYVASLRYCGSDAHATLLQIRKQNIATYACKNYL